MMGDVYGWTVAQLGHCHLQKISMAAQGQGLLFYKHGLVVGVRCGHFADLYVESSPI